MSRNLSRILKLIKYRQRFVDRINNVNAVYQPRIDKLVEARDLKTKTARQIVTSTSIAITSAMYSLTGTELGEVRRQYPNL